MSGPKTVTTDPPLLIRFHRCRVGGALHPALSSIDWELRAGEIWAVTGPNGGGKSAFAAAIAGKLPVAPNEEAGDDDPGEALFNVGGSAALVSFEEAAALIVRERANDDSDYVEGGIDEGTTVRTFLGPDLADHPAVRLCGVDPVLDRGLKRLSTGEMRRALLARALASEPAILILDEPFEGLDAAARITLESILDDLIAHGARGIRGGRPTALILVVDRWERIPSGVDHVVELRDRTVAFCGPRSAYERLRLERAAEASDAESASAFDVGAAISAELDAAAPLAAPPTIAGALSGDPAPLVEFRSVVVEWSGRRVIDHLDWTVRAGEHWLLRGPNGSGKTTILELITGDNTQVFRNDIRIFGAPRGSGESIWDLKARMGIVSYRLHVEYRFLEDTRAEDVLISGLHDSIGLYVQPGDAERLLAERWLALALLDEKAKTPFGDLSYGEQRALLVARAAIKEPPLVILDEPCHGLDEPHRRRVLELLETIAARGRSTLLHVTHDPTEALPCVRRILELRPERKPMWRILELDI